VASAAGDFDDEALTLTGREAIGGEGVSALLSEATGKLVQFVSPDLESFRSGLAENKLWHIDALIELYARVQEGRATHVSSVSADIEKRYRQAPAQFRGVCPGLFRPQKCQTTIRSSPGIATFLVPSLPARFVSRAGLADRVPAVTAIAWECSIGATYL
jgi:hypothetical protein